MKKFRTNYAIMNSNEFRQNVNIIFENNTIKLFNEDNLEEIISNEEIVNYEELGKEYLIVFTKQKRFLFGKIDFDTLKKYEQFKNEIKEIVIRNEIEKANKVNNLEFTIPFYIFEEIVEYVEQVALGKCKSEKWQNIKKLLRLAFVNDRLTKEQMEYLENTYNRES